MMENQDKEFYFDDRNFKEGSYENILTEVMETRYGGVIRFSFII